jgi:glyoxylase-like metal-dependent hydrolase (beta-lactamase superfamily II)
MNMINLNGTKHLVLDRRKFLGIASGLVAAGVLPKNVFALAGPYSFKQGAYDVTVVSDGTLLLPLNLIDSGGKDEEVKTLLGAMVQGDKAQFEASPLLLKSGSEVILIDTGSGSGPGTQPTAGKIADSLKAAGTDPATITKVIFTHAHPDHLWGTTGADGKSPFTAASFHMAETEWNFWVAPDLASKMPKEMEGMMKGTQGQLTAIKEKVNMFKPGVELVPGINVLDTAGHSPGHVSFELAGGDGMIITGDAITNPLFFQHPDWKFAFDADKDAAIAARKKMLDMAATGKKKLLGYHWPYPGIGMAEAKDGAYVYVAQT